MKPKIPIRILTALSITAMIGLLEVVPIQQPPSIRAQAATLEAPRDPECGTRNTVFLDGEEVVYKVYYNWGIFWTEAGMVHFKVHETDSSYNITASGSTAGFYDNFYRVRDTFETRLSKSTLLPTYFTREIEEGKYRKYNKFIFDQSRKRVVTYQGETRNSPLEKKDVHFSTCMHDVISIVYNMRNMDIEKMRPGESFAIDVFLEEHYPLNVKVLETDEKKKVRGIGRFDAHVIEPQLIAGEVFKEDSYMTVYVSADKNHLPLVIESPLVVGKMKAVLWDFKGLKYDLSAKLD